MEGGRRLLGQAAQRRLQGHGLGEAGFLVAPEGEREEEEREAREVEEREGW